MKIRDRDRNTDRKVVFPSSYERNEDLFLNEITVGNNQISPVLNFKKKTK